MEYPERALHYPLSSANSISPELMIILAICSYLMQIVPHSGSLQEYVGNISLTRSYELAEALSQPTQDGRGANAIFKNAICDEVDGTNNVSTVKNDCSHDHSSSLRTHSPTLTFPPCISVTRTQKGCSPSSPCLQNVPKRSCLSLMSVETVSKRHTVCTEVGLCSRTEGAQIRDHLGII